MHEKKWAKLTKNHTFREIDFSKSKIQNRRIIDEENI